MSPRPASDEVIPGVAAISVGDPGTDVPEGWTRLRLTDVARLETGHTPSRKHPEYWGGDIPWVSLPDARKHHGGVIIDTTQHTNELGLANSSARLLPSDTVCLSRTASVGYVFRLGMPMATSQDFVNWVCSETLDPRFLMYALLAEGDHILNFGKGSTHTTIYFPEVLAFHITLPPLAEQGRIVEKVEALLARVEFARERLRRALRWLAAFRRSILAQAYRGDFGNVSEIDVEDHAKYASLGDLAKDFSYGTSAKSSASGTTPVLRMGNIQNGKLDWQDLVYASDPKEIKTYELQPGDVLFNRTNSPELVGKTALYQGERPSIYAGYLIRIRCSARLVPAYLNYCLNSPQGRTFCDSAKTDGVSQSNINATKLRTFPIASISVERQNEIVRAVDTLMKQADAVEGRIGGALSRTATLRQSILAKAFAGELVPTEAELARRKNRDYEPASSLLERMQQKPATQGRVKKPRARRR